MDTNALLLLVNPRSRRGERSARELGALLEKGAGPVIARSSDSPRAMDAAIRQHHGAVRAVVIAGGDGTLHHAVPALVELGLTLGILPLGTANDLARTLGIPADADAAAHIVLTGVTQAVDLGRVNGRYFLNVASMGLGPQVTRELSEQAKARLGPLGYVHALGAAYRKRDTFRIHVDCDGRHSRTRMIHAAVGNGRYYGGGATVHAQTRIDDGLLEMFAIRPYGFWKLLALGPWLHRGRHGILGASRSWRGRVITVTTRRPIAVSADGEEVAHTPARFEVMPGALRVLVAADPAQRGEGLMNVAR